jgi:integral membrane protein
MPNALTRYRIMAYVTGVGLVLLVCVAMPLKYFADSPGMVHVIGMLHGYLYICLLYTSPSPRDRTRSRMPSSA